ncbi:uncharacterized protein [Miscanthus floridulus]|uniref:uncharacterized protein n=1 Tax=Miscanthus floridulus TaxID=154761 RepID=UPI003457E4F1
MWLLGTRVYDADGDISRYLQTPSLDSHVLAVPDGEPVATHVGAPQHVPPVQGGVALPTALPPPLNMSMAFGNDDDVQNQHAMTVDVQPLQGQGLDDGHSVLPELLGTLSLYDHYSMDDEDYSVDALFKSAEDAGNNDSSAVAEHAVFPVEEGLTFVVPFVRGQLDCSKCRSVREVLHESANHKLYFVVHVGDPAGTFQHAIIDRAYINASGQTILNELMYVDLRERTHGCVRNFIANSVEMLKNDTSGQLTDSCSTSQANNAMHIQLEIDMLKEILSAPSSNTEAVGLSQSGPKGPHQTVTRADENTNNADDTVLINAANWPVFSPAILESSEVSVQHGMSWSSDASATGYESLLAKQRRTISQLTMKDIANLMHMSKKDAAKEMNISVTSLKRLCRKNNTDRWPARKINSLDSQIKKLEQAALRNVGTRGLLAIKEKMEMLKYEKAQVYTSVLKVIQETQKHNDGAGGSSG